MQQTVELDEACEVDDVPVSALLSVERKNRYGSVPGLDDDELADPAELERAVILEEWGPVLMLPVQGAKSGIVPAVDESGGGDWGAFGTVDFERTMPEFDKARYKAVMLREQLKDVVIIMSIVSERLPGRVKYFVLKYLKMGAIELEHIIYPDMAALARLYLRAQRLREEIKVLEEASEAKRRKKVERFLAEV